MSGDNGENGDTDWSKHQGPDGKFLPGNPGGPIASRPRSIKTPKAIAETCRTIAEAVYDMLDAEYEHVDEKTGATGRVSGRDKLFADLRKKFDAAPVATMLRVVDPLLRLVNELHGRKIRITAEVTHRQVIEQISNALLGREPDLSELGMMTSDGENGEPE